MVRGSLYMRPSDIRYSQDSIKNTFSKPDRHEGKRIGDTLDELCEGSCTVDDIDPIQVFQKDGHWFSGDNRRLWVFRQFERLGGCDTVPVRETNSSRIDPRKFTTENGGTDIRVRGYRGDPGGTWHRKADKYLRRRSNKSSAKQNISHHNVYNTSDGYFCDIIGTQLRESHSRGYPTAMNKTEVVPAQPRIAAPRNPYSAQRTYNSPQRIQPAAPTYPTPYQKPNPTVYQPQVRQPDNTSPQPSVYPNRKQMDYIDDQPIPNNVRMNNTPVSGKSHYHSPRESKKCCCVIS